ncbi:MAG: CRISPR-associated endonuclease Cas2 [Candidatus Omnitrophota bacterium]
MLVVVSYDVVTSDKGGQRRLRRVAKVCKDYGQRVQYSVFECIVDPAQWTVLRQKLINEIEQEDDSLRFYFLGANWKNRIEHIGAKKIPNLEEDALII